jgi:hypothetical protein
LAVLHTALRTTAAEIRRQQQAAQDEAQYG